MLNKRITRWLPMAAILALIAVAFLAAPVFAQDEAPAEPAPEEIPLEEAPPVEVLPEAMPEGVALAVENESGEAVSLASEEAAGILAEGDPSFKVGTVEYNFTTADCDPIAGGNQPCGNPIQAAIDWIRDNATIPTDGLIHIGEGTYNSMPFVIDGSNVNVNKLKGLLGSVNAATNQPNVFLNDRIYVTNKTTPFTLSGLSVIGSFPNVALVEFSNNSGAMTLQDMVITNSGGIASTGLRMEQTGAITLNRVNLNNNPVDGAVLDNDAGTAGITITNSSFENNGTSGAGEALTISSKGAVLLNNISLFQNQQTGLLATTTKSLTIKNSVFVINGDDTHHALTVQPGSAGLVWIENSAFRNNLQDSIHIDLAGDVTLKNLNVESSSRYGAYINTCAPGGVPGTACSVLGNGNVTITGSRFYSTHNDSNFSQDGEAALFAWAKGAITLTDVDINTSGYYNSAADNALTYGAYLNNADAPSAKNVTVLKGVFSNNTLSGLYIRTRGSVSLNNLNAYYNYIFSAPDPNTHGVYIDASAGTGTVTLSDTLGSSLFTRNDGDGLHILAKGSVSLTNLQANYNGNNSVYDDGMGVYIDNYAGTGSVTLKKVFAYNNRNSGMEILSKGSVTLDTGEYQSNGQSGAGTSVKIGDPATPAGAVTLKNLAISYNYIDGLTVHTKSNVLMDYVRVTQNNSGSSNPLGAFIDATYGTGTVTLQNKVTAGAGSLNSFSTNDLYGLQILAKGKISLSDANINNNAGGDGLFIDNSSGSGDVVLTHIYSEANYEDGIQIISSGNVILNTGTADNNGNGGTAGYGILINNTPASTAKTVTITNFGGSYNTDLGFWVRSDGAINLKSIGAFSNGNASAIINAAGALFDNTSGIAAGVTMTRAVNPNVFATHSSAGMPGLRVLSNGAVSLASVLAYGNDLAGVIIKNDYAGKTGGVTLADLNVYSNDEQNLVVYTNGVVKLTGGSFSTSSSTSPNVEIYSLPSTTALPAISISKVDIWDSAGTGLYVESKGSITLNAVTSENNRIGMELDNQTGSGGVSFLGTLGMNEVKYSGFEGLKIQSRGAILLSRLDVTDNGQSGSSSGPAIHGAILNNTFGALDVTLTNVNFTSNVYGSGVQISTLGKVTWTGGNVQSNGYNLTAGAPGVWINNQPASFDPLAPARTITFTNLEIHNNSGDGMVVKATGAITLSGVKIYDQNESTVNYVASLDNSAYSGGVTISGTGNQFVGYANLANLLIATTGKVSMANLEVRNGDRRGVEIDNKAGKQDVIITNATISGNGRNGLTIVSLGNITLTGVTASSNGSSISYYNAILDNNDDLALIKNVTLNKCNFDYGNGNGLYVMTNGNILINKINASNHYATNAFGIYLDNTTGTGSISILSTLGANKISSNNSDNLYILSNGAVTINGLTASGSSLYSGVTIRNDTAPAGSYPGVTVNNSTFDDNASLGLSVATKGAITLTSVTGQNNGYGNASLDNRWDDTNTRAITVTRSTFYGGGGSGGSGLAITASAAVILNTVSAKGTARDGVYINASTFSNGPVTISGTNVFSENSWSGLVITANGVVTISNVTASGNSDNGLNITTTKAITITNAVIKSNSDEGILATAGGNIIITGVTAMLNGIDGLRLTATGYNITITNGIVTANGNNGIEVTTGAANTLTLKNTLWAGNGYPYNPNVADLVYDGTLVIQ